MRRRLLVATALGVVAIGSVAAAWLQEPAALTAADAADAAEEAFADVGLEASLQGEPLATTYHGAGREPVDVWSVLLAVRDGLVQLQLERSGADPVAIDDRAMEGSTYLLSYAEYESVARNVDDPALARTVRRNIAITIAAALVVALCLALIVISSKEEPVP